MRLWGASARLVKLKLVLVPSKEARTLKAPAIVLAVAVVLARPVLSRVTLVVAKVADGPVADRPVADGPVADGPVVGVLKVTTPCKGLPKVASVALTLKGVLKAVLTTVLWLFPAIGLRLIPWNSTAPKSIAAPIVRMPPR